MLKNEKKIVAEFLKQVGDNKVPSYREFMAGLFDEGERLVLAIYFPEAKKHMKEVYKVCVRAYCKKIEKEWNDGHDKMEDALQKLDEVEKYEVF